MNDIFKDIPILLIDVSSFTTQETSRQRKVLQRLEGMLTDTAKFFMPYGGTYGQSGIVTARVMDITSCSMGGCRPKSP